MWRGQQAHIVYFLSLLGALLGLSLSTTTYAQSHPATSLYNTQQGPTGGLQTVGYRNAYAGSLRLQLLADFFIVDDFLFEGDQHRFTAGHLSFSWSVLSFLELFASTRVVGSHNTQSDPELLQALGDLHWGVKAGYSPLPWLSMGGDLNVTMLNRIGDLGFAATSTNVGLRAGLSTDFRYLEKGIPLILRFNTQYLFNQSAKLVSGIESRRLTALVNAGNNPDNESRHLISRAERFAFNVNRTDTVDLSVGIEVPWDVGRGWRLNPLAEWNWSIPVNRQGFDCVRPSADNTQNDEDRCLDDVGIKAFGMTANLGLRVRPPLRGLSFIAAGQVGITGTSTFTRELTPTAPYRVMLGLAYSYDAIPRAQMTTGSHAPSQPTQAGHSIEGRVYGGSRKVPVHEAKIYFTDNQHSALLSNEKGEFRTAPLENTRHTLRIVHPDYQESYCAVSAPHPPSAKQQDFQRRHSTQTIPVECFLNDLPPRGKLVIQVFNIDNAPIAGAQITATSSAQSLKPVHTDAAGKVMLQKLSIGTYRIHFEAEGYLLRVRTIDIKQGNKEAKLAVQLIRRPEEAQVDLRDDQLITRGKIQFRVNSARLHPASNYILEQVADLLLQHQEIKRLRIEGHTDSRGSEQYNRRLSRDRANAVKQWLVEQGVEAHRLEGRGFGSSQPVAPNNNASGRSRNRRVQFTVLKREEAKKP